jgi:hypothetical protein
MSFLTFMSSPAGRLTRVVAGAAMIAIGIAIGGGWIALSVVGVLPLATGALDVCLFAPLARMPLAGKAFRKAINKA